MGFCVHIFKLMTIVMLGLLIGCSSEGVKSPVSDVPENKIEPESAELEQQKPKDSTPQASISKNVVKKDAKKDKATAIDPKVLYLLLSAELAGQRNQYDVALEGYLQAANQVDDTRIAERAAKIALFMQENKKAGEAVNLWLRQDAGNINAQTLAALTALRAGQKKPALEHLQALLKLDPAGFENTFLDLLKSLGESEKTSLLASVLGELALKNPDQAVIYFVQSLLAMQNKDYSDAEGKLQKALSLQPSWDKALVAQAQLAVLVNNFDKAERLLRDAVVKFPEDIKFKRMLAQALIKANKFPVAIATYQEIVKAHPDDGDSLFSLALLHLQLQQDVEAKKYLENLMNRPEWAGQASFYLGKLAAKEGDFKKALVWFDSVTTGPFEAEAALSAVSLLMEEQRYNDAHERLDGMQIKFPQQKVRILAMQAEVYNEQKEFAKAFKILTDALRELPGQKEFLYTRSLVAERMGNLVVMEKDLKEILSKFPDDAAALNALGYTLANKTQRFSEAEKYLSKALNLQPDVAVIMDSYGWLLFKQGRLQEAKDYLQRAYAKQAEPEIGGHLVEVLWRLELKQEAKEIFDKALKTDPKDDYLLDLQQRLFAN